MYGEIVIFHEIAVHFSLLIHFSAWEGRPFPSVILSAFIMSTFFQYSTRTRRTSPMARMAAAVGSPMDSPRSTMV